MLSVDWVGRAAQFSQTHSAKPLHIPIEEPRPLFRLQFFAVQTEIISVEQKFGTIYWQLSYLSFSESPCLKEKNQEMKADKSMTFILRVREAGGLCPFLPIFFSLLRRSFESRDLDHESLGSLDDGLYFDLDLYELGALTSYRHWYNLATLKNVQPTEFTQFQKAKARESCLNLSLLIQVSKNP